MLRCSSSVSSNSSVGRWVSEFETEWRVSGVLQVGLGLKGPNLKDKRWLLGHLYERTFVLYIHMALKDWT